MATLLLFALSAILGLLLPSSCGAQHADNYLLSGQTLNTDEELSYGKYVLVVEENCNLYLHGTRWQSHTSSYGKNCFLRLDHNGNLSIRDDRSKEIWSTNTTSTTEGNYVLIVQVDGEATIYGPAIWSTGPNRKKVTKVEKIASKVPHEVL